MEQEIQSNLLRLSILVASSLSTLSEPVAPIIVEDQTSPEKSSEQLSQQILGDLKTLITTVQKTCTNLTLALRPNTKQLESKETKLSPIAGLDDASLTAAKAQITIILNECIPKLIFLARKAICEAIIYRYVPKSKEDLENEKAEKELVQAKGGHYIVPSHARETEKLEKINGRGLGQAWSRSISLAVFELLESLGELSKAYMDDRTIKILEKASATRKKADGFTSLLEDEEEDRIAKNAKEARQLALQATAVVWEVCDSCLKVADKLPKNNREAVQIIFRKRGEMLKDAQRELNDSIEDEEEEDEGGKRADTLNTDDPLADLDSTHLDGEQKATAKKCLPFIKACCQFHESVKERCLSKPIDNGAITIDFDDLNRAGESILEGVDDLIAILLYGSGLEDEGSDEEEVEDELRDAKEDLIDAVCILRDAAGQNGNTQSHFDDQVKRIKEL